MQPTKTYRAKVRLPWAKKRLEIGEQFEAPEKIGRILVLDGKAMEDAGETMVAAEVMARASKSEPMAEEETPKPARTYQRRDMVADPDPYIKMIETPPTVQAPAKPKRGRPFGAGKRSR